MRSQPLSCDRFGRTRGRPERALAAALLAWLALGCNRAKTLDANIETVQHRLEQVLGSGGYYCAPRELALARAYLEFARADLARGNPSAAGDHLQQASLNARAAGRLSPPDRCAAPGVSTTEIPHTEGPDRDYDGISDDADGCPTQPEDQDGFQDTDGCPEADNDQDGVIDTLDHCPNQAEDVDGYQDSDGCPEPDNDEDGIADASDRCPLEPGSAADAGCPRLKYKGVEITPRALRIEQPIQFGNDTAVIRSVSFALLDAIVEALKDHSEIKLEIQGHTDSGGDDAHNLKLSQTRADSVRRYLLEHGVDPSRLTAQGYGETRPIESNQTSQGREINRRIELVRTDVAP